MRRSKCLWTARNPFSDLTDPVLSHADPIRETPRTYFDSGRSVMRLREPPVRKEIRLTHNALVLKNAQPLAMPATSNLTTKEIDVKRLIQTSAPASVFLIRLAVGGVFFSEGIQKFLYPAENGAGRFAKVGVPAPEVMGPFVGVVEIVCGGLILVGLLTRLATIPLIVDILVAILTTKIPVLLGHEFWGFSLRTLPYYGFWGMLHAATTDFAMLLGSIFLLIVGGGLWSIDARLSPGGPGFSSSVTLYAVIILLCLNPADTKGRHLPPFTEVSDALAHTSGSVGLREVFHVTEPRASCGVYISHLCRLAMPASHHPDPDLMQA